VTGANPNAADAVDDGVGVYSLLAVITHLGKSTDHGHYVCHVRRGDAWVLYNDDKVCVPRTVPLEHGFMYLYVRVDGDLEKLYT
jgi:ubiquitin carboxyl-terminal hydrolase 5/13